MAPATSRNNLGQAQTLLEVKSALGEPFACGDGFLIYHGDCRELIAKLPANLVPLTVTSPPYNIGKVYESIVPVQHYLDWCESWISDLHRVTSETGAFWLNLGYLHVPERAKALPIPYLLWDRIPFYLLQEIVWNYGAGVASKLTFSPRNEKFLWYVKDEQNYTFNLDAVRDPDVKYPNQKKNGKLRCNPLGKNPSDVWRIPKVTSGRGRSSKERTSHPAQFPTELVGRVIAASSNSGDLVLDPFAGSGSTIEASIRLGRPVVGFEIDLGYAEIAAKRARDFVRRLDSVNPQEHLFGYDS